MAGEEPDVPPEVAKKEQSQKIQDLNREIAELQKQQAQVAQVAQASE